MLVTCVTPAYDNDIPQSVRRCEGCDTIGQWKLIRGHRLVRKEGPWEAAQKATTGADLRGKHRRLRECRRCSEVEFVLHHLFFSKEGWR